VRSQHEADNEQIFNGLHGVASQRIELVTAAVRASNPTFIYLFDGAASGPSIEPEYD
jgi:hypothetical protein